MTPTREETLLAEIEALRASLPEVARKAREEALEACLRIADAAVADTDIEVKRCNADDTSSHLPYWAGNNAMAVKMRDALRALKSKKEGGK